MHRNLTKEPTAVADPTTVEAMTNTTPNSCVDVRCDCNTMWSMAQQYSYLRLSDEIAGVAHK